VAEIYRAPLCAIFAKRCRPKFNGSCEMVSQLADEAKPATELAISLRQFCSIFMTFSGTAGNVTWVKDQHTGRWPGEPL